MLNSDLYNSSIKNHLESLTENATYDTLKSDYCTEQEFNAKYGSLSNANIELNAFHLNIRSLNANQVNLIQLINMFDMKLI
jgi:hypothetical protein